MCILAVMYSARGKITWKSSVREKFGRVFDFTEVYFQTLNLLYPTSLYKTPFNTTQPSLSDASNILNDHNMTAIITEADLHAFHLSRLQPSSSTSSIHVPTSHQSREKPFSQPTRYHISEAEVHLHHLANLPVHPPLGKKDTRRRSVPHHASEKVRTRPRPPMRFSSSSLSIIALSDPSTHAEVPSQAVMPHEPLNQQRGSSSPFPRYDRSDDDFDQLCSSSAIDYQTRRGSSSITSASSVIPSSPVAVIVQSEQNRPLALEMMGEVKGKGEVVAAARDLLEREDWGLRLDLARKKVIKIKKSKTGPSWVTSTPTGV